MPGMDQDTPREDASTKPLKPARVALNVLALCFALSVLGRGLGESFTVFLKPISEDFGWDRAQVVSVYSLTWLACGLTAPKISVQPGLSSEIIILSFAIVVIGGLGSIEGAAVGAILVGLARAASVHLLPQAELFMIYLIMAAVLMFRPEGLFRREVARRI